MSKDQLLEMLKENARLTPIELARRLNCPAAEVNDALHELELTGIIKGYTVILDEAALDKNEVKALIEVKVTPRREGGFDQVARRIAKYPEVTEVSLVSGSYDLLLTVEGDSLNEVANFVAAKLATIDGVISCSTSFQLKKYKCAGHILESDEDYERLKICP